MPKTRKRSAAVEHGSEESLDRFKLRLDLRLHLCSLCLDDLCSLRFEFCSLCLDLRSLFLDDLCSLRLLTRSAVSAFSCLIRPVNPYHSRVLPAADVLMYVGRLGDVHVRVVLMPARVRPLGLHDELCPLS